MNSTYTTNMTFKNFWEAIAKDDVRDGKTENNFQARIAKYRAKYDDAKIAEAERFYNQSFNYWSAPE